MYIRLKETEAAYIAEQLLDVRPDILAILPYDNDCQRSKTTSTDAMIEAKTTGSIVTRHLTHSVLMAWFNAGVLELPITTVFVVLCHLHFHRLAIHI